MWLNYTYDTASLVEGHFRLLVRRGDRAGPRPSTAGGAVALLVTAGLVDAMAVRAVGAGVCVSLTSSGH